MVNRWWFEYSSIKRWWLIREKRTGMMRSYLFLFLFVIVFFFSSFIFADDDSAKKKNINKSNKWSSVNTQMKESSLLLLSLSHWGTVEAVRVLFRAASWCSLFSLLNDAGTDRNINDDEWHNYTRVMFSYESLMTRFISIISKRSYERRNAPLIVISVWPTSRKVVDSTVVPCNSKHKLDQSQLIWLSKRIPSATSVGVDREFL